MTTRALSPLLACLAADPAFAVGAVLTQLAALNAGADAPAEIKIAPRGRVTTRDGRSYEFDPEALVARFSADGVDVPLDLDHGIARKAMFGETAPAVGWVKSLSAKPDGLYGAVEWLDAGKAALSARTHRYISPTFPHDEAGKATYLHSVALVAAPALSSLPALAGADPSLKGAPMLKKIAKALGLAEDADETACLTAIAKIGERPDMSQYVGLAVHQATLTTLAATKTQLETLTSTLRKDKVDRVIEMALTAKKITPAQKDGYVALCATDEGLEQVMKLLEVTPAMLAATNLDKKDPTKNEGALTELHLSVCSMLGIDPEAYKKQLATA